MPPLASDVRIAVRTLLRARGFTATAVGTLGLGLALAVTVVAVVNAYLLRSLPYPEARRLYSIRYAPPDWSAAERLTSLDWHALDDVIEHPIAWDLDMFYLLGGELPERAPGAWVTPGFMEGLGVRTAIGRAFTRADFRTGAGEVALISHALWQRRFGGSPAALGQRFRAYVSDRPEEAETFQVIGVLPAGFWHVNPYTDVIVPLRAQTYPYMARLREGVPPEAAERRIAGLVRQGVGTLPPGWAVSLRSVHGEYVTRVKPTLVTVAAAAALVLGIAFANVTFLLLVRALRRDAEIAVRQALGAGRGHLARLLAAEGLVLTGAATVAGLGAGWLALQWLRPIVGQQLGRPAPGGPSAITIDGGVLVILLGCGIVSTCVCALAPLAAALRGSLAEAMQRGSRSGRETPRSRRVRSGLVALELGASLALMAGCGLMVRTVVHLRFVDVGFHAQPVLAASLGLRERSYPDAPARLAFYDRLLPRLAAVPGVEAVTLAGWPAVAPAPTSAVRAADGASIAASARAVSPEYFATLGIRRVSGRDFDRGDRIGGAPVAIVSETVASRLWPSASALDRRIFVSGRTPGNVEGDRWRTVVGVTADVRQSSTDEDLADVYVPFLDAPARFASVYARTTGPPVASLRALRQAAGEIDREVSLEGLGSLEELLANERRGPRFLGILLAIFAGVAVALALVGVYGLVAYGVSQRRHEIAVRIAFGADPRAVPRRFVREGAAIAGLGLLPGLYGARVMGRLLETQVHGVRTDDLVTLVVAAGTLAAAAIVAAWWPARRAAATDPAIALREP
jgi:putative ABC transport system permease protein